MTARDDERLTRLESKMDFASTLFQDAYGRLDEIASQQAATNERLDLLREETNERLDLLREETNERLDLLRKETTERVDLFRKETTERVDLFRKETTERADRTNERLDRLIEVTTRSHTDWVGRYSGLDARVTALEDRVDRLEE